MEEKLISYLRKYGNPDKLEENVKKLKDGIPVQYIIGNVDFYGYQFCVNENVLIPRFETEELVNRTMEYSRQLGITTPKVLDIGTGSGCIAITMAKELLNSIVTAVDVSKEALEVANINSSNNKANVQFIESDLFNNINGKYNIIISNPPYISYDEEIEEIVKNNEPHLALFAANNGLYFYDKILEQAKEYLISPSLIAFEIGQTQGNEICELAKKYFLNSEITLEKDLQGKDRFVFIKTK